MSSTLPWHNIYIILLIIILDGLEGDTRIYYPNLVILPVYNNEHQRIDDVSTDRISYDIRSVETMGFAL